MRNEELGMRNGHSLPELCPSTEQSDFAVAGLARIFVGAGALDSPFGERRGFEVLQGCVDVPYGKRCAMVR